MWQWIYVEVEIITDFIKLNGEIPVCVTATVDDLQVLKLQISESMSTYFTSVAQQLKEVSSDQQNFIIKDLDARKSVALKNQPGTLLMKISSLKSG